MSDNHQSSIPNHQSSPTKNLKKTTTKPANVDASPDEPQVVPERKNFCQRCLNHGFEYPRKGHKLTCSYLFCECTDCAMIEKRRLLNRALKSTKASQPKNDKDRKKSREMFCAKCSQHGIKVLLRGHYRRKCENEKCTCEACTMVDARRSVMAQQIKLRRKQQKEKMLALKENSRSCDETSVTSFSDAGSPLSQQEVPARQASPVIQQSADKELMDSTSVLVRLIRQPPRTLQLPVRPAYLPQNNPIMFFPQPPNMINPIPFLLFSFPGFLTREAAINSCLLPLLPTFNHF